MDLTTIEQLATIGNAIATIVLVILFLVAIKQMEETVKLSRLQATHRFRPWIGPSNSIELMHVTPEGHRQFVITLKNYGEIPTSNVLAKFTAKDEPLTREILTKYKENQSFNLGPLLPSMEKRYWFVIEHDLIQKAQQDNSKIFISLNFVYEYPTGKSGYNMISHFDPKTNTFVHKEMWVD
ncbi:MAG: hypothetical protein ACREAF_02335 [Nitrosopumilaceae archaeon]